MKLIATILTVVPETTIEGAKTVVALVAMACPIAFMLSKTTKSEIDDNIVLLAQNVAAHLQPILNLTDTTERRKRLSEYLANLIEDYL